MRRLVCLPLLTFAWIVALAGVATAHAGFVSSTPEPGASLGATPGVVSLSFSEPLNRTLSRGTVTAPDGTSFQGRVTGSEQISVALTTNAQGAYEVDWTTVSLVDGHTLHGSFRFGVGVSVSAAETGGATSGPTARDLLIATARTIEDVALFLAVGLLLLGRISRSDPPLDWVRSRPTVALSVALFGGLLVVAGETLDAIPTASAGAAISYLTTGAPGVARFVRPILELVALLVAALWHPRWTWAPLSAALAALATAGHAAAVHPTWWGASVEAVHLGTTGMWAGGILALALQRPPDGWKGDGGRALLGRFTPVALAAFAASAGTGILRAIQELGSLRALFVSTYGEVLLLKVLLVALMVQLSVFAWRRLLVKPRLEAAVAILVVTVAALLAAFPVPPARLVDSNAAEGSTPSESALPRPGDLTLGGDAGQFLVGLTIRSTTHQAFVFVRGLEGDPATAARVVGITVDGRALAVTECAPTCRVASTDVRAGDDVDVTIAGQGGGTVRFEMPDYAARPADALLARAVSHMHALHTFRQDETLTAGGPTITTTYAFVAPKSFEAHTRQPGSGADTVWIGSTRYLRQLPGPWQVEKGGASPTVPSFVWDFFHPYLDARLIGHDTLEGVRTSIIAFFGGDQSQPVWFRLWIDANGLVRKAQMRAEGHFMDHRYYAFDTPVVIRPPSMGSTNGTGGTGG